MSRTNRGGKGDGYEYWTPRPGQWYELGRSAKRRTAKAERRESKCMESLESSDPCVVCGKTVEFDDSDICSRCEDKRHSHDQCRWCGGEKNPFIANVLCPECDNPY